MNTYISKSSVEINASAAKVWLALTDPAIVKQWLFGTDMEVSEWRIGGQIRYRGQWEGKAYEDKGEILEIDPEKKLVSTYWSGMSGKPDVPENYQKVSYTLDSQGNKTLLTITQENQTEDSAKHSEGNWNLVLSKLKQVVEQ